MRLLEIITRVVSGIVSFARQEIAAAITTGLVRTSVYSVRFKNIGKAWGGSYHTKHTFNGSRASKKEHFRHSHEKGI